MSVEEVQNGDACAKPGSCCGVNSLTGPRCPNPVPVRPDVFFKSCLRADDSFDYHVYTGDIYNSVLLGQEQMFLRRKEGSLLERSSPGCRLVPVVGAERAVTVRDLVYCKSGCQLCERVVPYVAFADVNGKVCRVCSEYCRVKRGKSFDGVRVKGRWNERNRRRRQSKQQKSNVVLSQNEIVPDFSSFVSSVQSSGGVALRSVSSINPDSSVSVAPFRAFEKKLGVMLDKFNEIFATFASDRSNAPTQ